MKIPKYKRDSYTFISNLKDVTASSAFPITLNRNGYLLSEYYTDDFHEKLAKWVKQRRNLLISDNGNFSRMKKIANAFTTESTQLLKIAQINGLNEDISKERKRLMKKIADACDKALSAQDKTTIIKNQLKICPDYIIALEDLTIPVFMICGLFDPVFSPNENDIEDYQKKSCNLYTAQREGHFDSKTKLKEVFKFHVLHSYDFLSAKQGSSYVKKLAPDGIAISFGGAMKSNRWVKAWNLGDKTVSFPEKLPDKYLITASIALGYLEGNPINTPVHILGVGSPILIALLGLLFHKSKAVSIDSTAPFKDAFQSNLYGSRYGFLKMDMYKVAAYALINNKAYSSNTPYFKDFECVFPHNWSKLRSELGVSSATNVAALAQLLEEEKTLVESHIPFFTKMRAGNDSLINHLRIARSGHNYWILHNICASVRNRKNKPSLLAKWIDYQLGRYQQTAHPRWAETLKQIAKETKERIQC